MRKWLNFLLKVFPLILGIAILTFILWVITKHANKIIKAILTLMSLITGT